MEPEKSGIHSVYKRNIWLEGRQFNVAIVLIDNLDSVVRSQGMNESI